MATATANSEGGGDGKEEQEEEEEEEENVGGKDAEGTVMQPLAKTETIKSTAVKGKGKYVATAAKRRRGKGEETPQYRCEGCKHEFVEQRYVVQHLTRDKCPATKDMPYQCFRCGAIGDVEWLKAHEFKAHLNKYMSGYKSQK